ncbi:MAG TPA: preprotein translocase subunit SecG [Kiloniellales bacterium]|nr:preprotein translocase subunit SecG [Kiloniellales bacterium]
MMQILLAIHLLIVLALIGVVLMQRSEGGGLGIGGGGGGGGMGGFLSGRGTANLLTRTTAILAAGFMVTSILLTILAGGATQQRSIVDTPLIPSAPSSGEAQPVPPIPGEAVPGEAVPGGTEAPSVPVQ